MKNIQLYRIEKSHWYEGEYSLLISTNGFQWTEVYHGSEAKTHIVSEGYKKVGYTRAKINSQGGIVI